jgi:hypothetical protein
LRFSKIRFSSFGLDTETAFSRLQTRKAQAIGFTLHDWHNRRKSLERQPKPNRPRKGARLISSQALTG